MPVPTLRPLGFGEVLDGAFSLYRRNFGRFVATALVPSLALLVAGVLYALAMARAIQQTGSVAGASTAVTGPLLGLIGVGLLVVLLSWGALARQAAQAFTGAPIGTGEGLRAGLRAMLPLLGAGFLAILATLVGVAAVGLVGVILGTVGAAIGPAVAVVFVVLMGAGMLLVYATGGVLFAGAIPPIVIEGRGPLSGLTRSFDLLRGAYWRVVGLITVSVIIAYLPVVGVTFLTGTTSAMFNPLTTDTPGAGALVAQQVLGWVATVLTTPFVVSAIVLSYFDRRVRTEGLDVQVMADGLALAGE